MGDSSLESSTNRDQVFISYRRVDSRDAAGRLADSLQRLLGDDAVFRDAESIRSGQDFPDVLRAGLKRARVVLALIGPNWLANDHHQQLDDPGDWVRIELETSLHHEDVTVIPVLLNGAASPVQGNLPVELHSLTRLKHFTLDSDHWRRDVDALVVDLRSLGIVGQPSPLFPPPRVHTLAGSVETRARLTSAARALMRDGLMASDRSPGDAVGLVGLATVQALDPDLSGSVQGSEFDGFLREALEQSCFLRRSSHYFATHVGGTARHKTISGKITGQGKADSFVAVRVTDAGVVSVFFTEGTRKCSIDDFVAWWVWGAWTLALELLAELGQAGRIAAIIDADIDSLDTTPARTALTGPVEDIFLLDAGSVLPAQKSRHADFGRLRFDAAEQMPQVRQRLMWNANILDSAWWIRQDDSESLSSAPSSDDWTPIQARARLGLGRPRD